MRAEWPRGSEARRVPSACPTAAQVGGRPRGETIIRDGPPHRQRSPSCSPTSRDRLACSASSGPAYGDVLVRHHGPVRGADRCARRSRGRHPGRGVLRRFRASEGRGGGRRHGAAVHEAEPWLTAAVQQCGWGCTPPSPKPERAATSGWASIAPPRISPSGTEAGLLSFHRGLVDEDEAPGLEAP